MHFIIAAIAALASISADAQNVVEEPKADPVLEAITEFNNQDTEKKPEAVTATPVVPEESPSVAEAEPTAKPGAEKPISPEAVLVTGKPPEVSTIAAADAPIEVPAQEVAPVDTPPKSQQGLAVHVEKMNSGNASIDPKQIKLLAPFPAKALAKPPAGWHLVASENAPPFTRKVEIAAGSEVTLTIRPHLLVPDADGANVFSIPESGYQPSLGYQQTETVGAILSNSIRQLDKDSKQLGDAIDSLQQLLISLPKPEAQSEVKSVIAPLPTRKR